MPLADMSNMLQHAYHNKYAVGGFDLVSLDFLQAIIDAAENSRSPVILSLAESHFEHYDFELAMAAAEKAARRATVPVAIHLDHGRSRETAVRAINLGCNGIMVDCSDEAFSVNVAQTREMVEMAHGCGVTVEGELGYVVGVEGEDAVKHPGETVYTSVAEAKAYVERTAVDCLAVSIGTVHGRMRGRPKLDFDRLKRINAAVGIPLVIHGGTGLSDDQYHRLVSNGVAKLNYYTALSDAAAGCIRQNAHTDPRCGYTGLAQNVRQCIQAEVERCMRLWGSAGRAAEVLMQCHEWRPVQHVIVYNVDQASDAQVEAMMERGGEVLASIPGVRRVVSGWAMTDKAQFRFCWLIEFAHEKVIDSYRDHPAHKAFANGSFRPIASNRITIDFAERVVSDRSVGTDLRSLRA